MLSLGNLLEDKYQSNLSLHGTILHINNFFKENLAHIEEADRASGSTEKESRDLIFSTHAKIGFQMTSDLLVSINFVAIKSTLKTSDMQ